jgi:hypothetical protein
MLKTKEISGDKKNVMKKSANKMNVMRSIIVSIFFCLSVIINTYLDSVKIYNKNHAKVTFQYQNVSKFFQQVPNHSILE